MALSPWKRLTQLMLRRRPADQVQALISDDRNASDEVIDTPDVAFANPKVDDEQKSELEPIPVLADKLLQAGEAEETEAVEAAAESEAAREPLREDEQPVGDQVAPTEQPVQQPHEGQVKKARRPRRNLTKAAPPGQAEQDHISTSDKTRSSSFELTALDAEIRSLREQLSAKLRIQNAQLKQMLKRFEQR